MHLWSEGKLNLYDPDQSVSKVLECLHDVVSVSVSFNDSKVYAVTESGSLYNIDVDNDASTLVYTQGEKGVSCLLHLMPMWIKFTIQLPISL